MSEGVTDLLRAVEQGEEGSEQRLFELVYADLKRIAAHRMAGERATHTLQPTALVHEMYPRLMGGNELRWRDRRHFLGAAAEAMRRVLVDHARQRSSDKRGGAEPFHVELSRSRAHNPAEGEDVLLLDAALKKLELQDKQRASIVKLKFFIGLEHMQIAGALEISVRSVERHWALARAWLQREMRG